MYDLDWSLKIAEYFSFLEFMSLYVTIIKQYLR